MSMLARSKLCKVISATRNSKYCQFTTHKSDELLIENLDNKGILTFNRPKNHNSINLHIVRILHDTLKSWERNKVLIILKGAGERAYSSGGDIKQCLSLTGPSWPDFLREAYTLCHAIYKYPVPIVTFMNGITMGGGAAYALFGGYSVATEKTIFAMPEVAVGFAPDSGSSNFLAKLHGNLGAYLALTGDRLFGADMVRYGLAPYYCHSSYLQKLEEELLRKEISEPNQIKGIIEKFMEKSPMEESKMTTYFKFTDECFGYENVTEIMGRLEKLERGSDVLTKLKSMPPLCLKIVRKQMENGKKMSVPDCIKMEFRLNFRLSKHHNFSEGVRTLLVDKGSKPNWEPATLEEVTEEMVNGYFEPLKPEEELQL